MQDDTEYSRRCGINARNNEALKEMKMKRCTRRNFLRAVVYGGSAACVADGYFIERKWLCVRQVRLTDAPTVRLVHFSDLHYKGDRKYLSRVVQHLNELSPDFACFTGDIMEKTTYLSEALDILSGINCPVYGVPGNHEYWSKAPFTEIEACFNTTGGAWLYDHAVMTGDGHCLLEGLSGVNRPAHLGERVRLLLADVVEEKAKSREDIKRILLTHYPATANHLGDLTYDVILAGHSHGGQVRLPLAGALLTPGDVDGYDTGLYETPAGPLYVNVGIGTWHIPVRFLCRPEITLIEL